MITGPARRRRWRNEEKLRIIEESYEPDTSVSEVARRHGVAANLLIRWRKLLAEVEEWIAKRVRERDTVSYDKHRQPAS